MRLIISFIGICRWRCWLRSLGGQGMDFGLCMAGAIIIHC